jgi:hypothetical protein
MLWFLGCTSSATPKRKKEKWAKECKFIQLIVRSI